MGEWQSTHLWLPSQTCSLWMLRPRLPVFLGGGGRVRPCNFHLCDPGFLTRMLKPVVGNPPSIVGSHVSWCLTKGCTTAGGGGRRPGVHVPTWGPGSPTPAVPSPVKVGGSSLLTTPLPALGISHTKVTTGPLLTLWALSADGRGYKIWSKWADFCSPQICLFERQSYRSSIRCVTPQD